LTIANINYEPEKYVFDKYIVTTDYNGIIFKNKSVFKVSKGLQPSIILIHHNKVEFVNDTGIIPSDN